MSLLGRENDSLHAIRLVHIAASSVEKDNVVENVSSQCLQPHSTGSCQGKKYQSECQIVSVSNMKQSQYEFRQL